jgi:hypothetical protein
MSSDLTTRLLSRIIYEEKISILMNLRASCVLNRHVSMLNNHAVWHGNNAAQNVDSTRIRVILFLNSRSYVPATYIVYIVIKLVNTQCVKTTRTSVKITRMSVKIPRMNVKITRNVSKSHKTFKITRSVSKSHSCVWYSR